jgi:hypothetical protein
VTETTSAHLANQANPAWWTSDRATTIVELIVLFGILFYMGVVQRPELKTIGRKVHIVIPHLYEVRCQETDL